jgi:hypothetical protein
VTTNGQGDSLTALCALVGALFDTSDEIALVRSLRRAIAHG